MDRDLAEWKEACLNRDSLMRLKRAKAAKAAAAETLIRSRAELAAILVFGAARMQTLSDAILEGRDRRKVRSYVLDHMPVVVGLLQSAGFLMCRAKHLPECMTGMHMCIQSWTSQRSEALPWSGRGTRKWWPEPSLSRSCGEG